MVLELVRERALGMSLGLVWPVLIVLGAGAVRGGGSGRHAPFVNVKITDITHGFLFLAQTILFDFYFLPSFFFVLSSLG